MTKDSKDYTHYSKKNRFMKHNGTESFCVLCDRTFDGKRGAQSHSSKIHNMTLDGRKLNQEIEITPKLVSKETPPVENMSDEDEGYRRTMKDADRIIALNLKINQLEKTGLMDHASKLRIKYNIFSQQKPEKPADTISATMLLTLWNNETDTVRKNLLCQLYAMKSCGASDDDIISMMLMHMPNTIPEKPAEKSETQKQLELQIVRNGIENMNRDPLDDLLRIQKSTGKANNGSLNDLALRVEKLKESKMTHNDVLPDPAIGPVLPSAKRTVPFLINDNRKIPPVKHVFPMGETIFSKNSHSMYFEFDESTHNDDLKMSLKCCKHISCSILCTGA